MKKDAKRIGVWGGSGSGKSTRVKELIASGFKRVIVLDPMGDWKYEKGFKNVKKLRGKAGLYDTMSKNWNKGYKIVYTVDFSVVNPRQLLQDISKDILKPKDGIQKHYFESDGKKGYEICLVIDEMSDFYPNFSLKPSEMAFQQLCKQGRHHGVNVIGASQRLAEVHTSFRGNCNESYVFRQDSETDIARATSLIGKSHLMDIEALDTHEYLLRANGTVTKGKNQCNFNKRR